MDFQLLMMLVEELVECNLLHWLLKEESEAGELIETTTWWQCLMTSNMLVHKIILQVLQTNLETLRIEHNSNINQQPAAYHHVLVYLQRLLDLHKITIL